MKPKPRRMVPAPEGQKIRDALAKQIRFARNRKVNELFDYTVWDIPFSRLAKEGYKMRRWIFESIQKGNPNPIVVDLGCGGGAAIWQLKKFFPSIQAVGVSAGHTADWEFRSMGKRKDLVDYKVMGFHQIAKRFKPESIDVMYSHEGIRHIPPKAWEDIFRQIHLVLKPNAKMEFSWEVGNDQTPTKNLLRLLKQIGFEVQRKTSNLNSFTVITITKKEARK